MSSCFLSYSDDLKGQNVNVARVGGPDVVCETQTFTSDHSREMETRDLAQRCAVACVRCGIVDAHIVALRLRWEITVDGRGFDPAVRDRVFLQTLERGLKFILDRFVILFARSACAPLKAIELIEI